MTADAHYLCGHSQVAELLVTFKYRCQANVIQSTNMFLVTFYIVFWSSVFLVYFSA